MVFALLASPCMFFSDWDEFLMSTCSFGCCHVVVAIDVIFACTNAFDYLVMWLFE